MASTVRSIILCCIIMVGVYEGALFFGGCLFIEQFYVCMFWGLFVGICVYYVFVC